MRTILIAHRDVAFAEQLAFELREGGYRVTSCPGPRSPVEGCIHSDKGYCQLTEDADLMIYDPLLTALNVQGEHSTLAVESALAHPDVPLLLAWSPSAVPDLGTLRAIRAVAPHVHVAAYKPAALLRQIHGFLAPIVVLAPNPATAR